MFSLKSKNKLALLLALSLVLSGIPFPGNAQVAYATEAEGEATTSSETSEPTLNPLTFEGYELGQKVVDTSGNGFSWFVPSADKDAASAAIVVDRKLIDSTAADGDYCLAIDMSRLAKDSGVDRGAFQLMTDVSDDLGITYSSTDAPTKNIVIEMDIAIGGEEEFSAGTSYFIQAGHPGNGSGMMKNANAGMVLNVNHEKLINNITRNGNIDATTSNGVTALTKNEFVHIKYVIPNVMAGTTIGNTKYYVNGDCLTESGSINRGATVPHIYGLGFDIPVSELGKDIKLYLDNIKLYAEDIVATPEPTAEPTEEPTPEPTAEPTATPEPTPDPTAAPTHNPSTFEGYTSGEGIHNTSGAGFTWSGTNTSVAKVVSKSEVGFEGFELDDLCLAIDATKATSNTNYQLISDTVFAINTEDGAVADKQIVIEMDIAIAGDDDTGYVRPSDGIATGRYWMYVGGLNSGSFNRRTQIGVMSNKVGIHSSTGGSALQSAVEINKVEFVHVKYVLPNNGSDARFYVNNIPAGRGVASKLQNVNNVDRIQFQARYEDLPENSTLYIDNVKMYEVEIDYDVLMDDDFNDVPATGYLANGAFGDEYYTWTVPSAFANTIKYVAKSEVIGDAADTDDYCLKFPSNNSAAGNIQVTWDSDKKIVYGQEESGYEVIEMDIAVSGALYYDESNYPMINIGGNSNYSMERFQFYGTQFGPRSVGGKVELGTNTFHKMKVIIDRVNGTYSYMMDDKVLVRDEDSLHGIELHTMFENIKFYMLGTAEDQGNLYVDNIKVYKVEENLVPTPAPTAEPTATPEPTAEPTATPNPLTFEGYQLGAKVAGTSGAGFTWSRIDSGASATGVVVSKAEAGFEATADDYCLAISAKDIASGSGRFDLVYSNATEFDVDYEAVSPTKNIVVEMDVAVLGEDTPANGYAIFVGTGSITRIGQFAIKQTFFGNHSSTGFLDSRLEAKKTVNEGEFVHVKYVIPNNGQNMHYYVNGVPVQRPAYRVQQPSVIDRIRFAAQADDAGQNSTLYIDNIQMYQIDVQDPNVLIDDDLNTVPASGYLDGAKFDDGYHTWTIPATHTQMVKFVAKSDVTGVTGEPNDYCLEFPNNNETEAQFTLDFDSDKTFTYGGELTGYEVIEMDVAVSGNLTYTETTPVQIQVNGNGTYSMDRIQVSNTTVSSRKTGSSIAMDVNTFYQLKMVIDKANATYSLMLGDKVLARDSESLNTEHTGFESIRFSLPVATEDTGKLYVDNIKVYGVTTNPVPTAEPTAVPEHTHEPDEKGYCKVEGCGAIINGKYALYGRSLVLNDAIGVVFYMDFTENMDTENTVMKFKYNGKSDEIAFSKAINKTVKDEETGEEKTYYGFMCEVFASEMNEEITAELYEKGVKLDTYTYSVKNYCDNQLENDEIQAKPETFNLIKATAEYGAMSQLYFDENVTGAELVTTNTPAPLTAEDEAKLADVVGRTENIYNDGANYFKDGRVGMTLVLFAETALRAGMFLAEGYTIDDFDFVTYQVISEGEDKIVACREGTYDDVPYFEVPNIAPHELDNVYKFVIKLAGQEVVIKEITYSPMTYIKNKLYAEDSSDALKNVVLAMYRYNEAAEAYVDKYPTSTN